MNELNKLDLIAKDSWYAKGVSSVMVRYSFEIFARFLSGSSILEMGPAEGLMTEHLSKLGKRLVVVEGAQTFCENLRIRYPEIEVVHSLFENFDTNEKFDNIILGHVLEHVDSPEDILSSLKKFLSKDGRILCSVPNSRSLHRQAAVDMGLLEFEESMNEMDRHHGHRRVYNPETFRKVFRDAGLQIDFFGGYWIKPVSNSQIESSWNSQMIHAFMRLGERYPDIAAEIYIVASHKA